MTTHDSQAGASSRQHNRELVVLRVLLRDALSAGKYLSSNEDWKPHHDGEKLDFFDHGTSVQRPGRLVLADELSAPVVAESVASDLRSYVLVGARLGPSVDAGRARSERLRHAAEREHYWAVFVLDGAILVSIGTPPSSCRLIGEVVNLQMATPFVQRRVCARCHALNDYHVVACARCGNRLSATGRLD